MTMNKNRVDEIEKIVKSNLTKDRDVQAMLQECIDEIRRLNNNFTYALPGQHIIISSNTNSHGFDVGEECIVVNWEEFDESDNSDWGIEVKSLQSNDHWFVRHGDYVILNK